MVVGEIELTLYVAGNGARAKNSLEQVQRLCADHLAGQARLCVVDLLDDPGAAQAEGVFLTPTLVKQAPGPMRRVFGDLRDPQEVLWALELDTYASNGEHGRR